MSDATQKLLPLFAAPALRTGAGWPVEFFLGLRPDGAALERIHAVAASLCRSEPGFGAPIGTERYHLSLHGSYPEREGPQDVLARIKQAAATMAARGFAVCLDRVSNFGNKAARHAVVLTTQSEMPGLARLHDRLDAALRAAGLKTRRAFAPHVTLFYGRGLVPETPLPPIRWQVRDFVLIRSIIGAARHEEIARWRLAD